MGFLSEVLKGHCTVLNNASPLPFERLITTFLLTKSCQNDHCNSLHPMSAGCVHGMCVCAGQEAGSAHVRVGMTCQIHVGTILLV